jgi:hypothetical protein
MVAGVAELAEASVYFYKTKDLNSFSTNIAAV